MSLTALLMSGAALATPQGGDVVSGAAVITQTGGETRIDQTSDQALIDWRGFSVEAGQGVTFNQPNAGALTVNRVTGGDVSRIHGAINANGNVWLLNPAGVLIGQGARVDAGGLLASTARLDETAYAQGEYAFSGAPSGSEVSIVGDVRVGQGGLVAAAPRVSVSGDARSSGGDVIAASVEAFRLEMLGEGLLGLEVVAPAPDGGVDVSGRIESVGADVRLLAEGVENARRSVLNLSGVARATRLENRGGAIYLSGGDNGRVDVSGALETPGGDVTVTGAQVALLTGADIDASSSDGAGGRVAIGTRGDAPDQVYMSSGAEISADGATAGGDVTFWSETSTDARGAVSARGEGGAIDVSSAGALGFSGRADAESLTFDPVNVIIEAAVSGGSADTDVPFNAQPDDLSVDVSAINTATGTVKIQATNNVSVTAEIDTRAQVTLEAGNNVNVSANIHAAGGVTLTADAGFAAAEASNGVGEIALQGERVIASRQAVVLNGPKVSAGALTLLTGGSVDINAPVEAQGRFEIVSNAAVTVDHSITAQGVALVGSSNTVTVSAPITSQNDDVKVWAAGNAIINANLTAQGQDGDIVVVADADFRVVAQDVDPQAPGLRGDLVATASHADGVGSATIGSSATLQAADDVQIYAPERIEIRSGAQVTAGISIAPNADVELYSDNETYVAGNVTGAGEVLFRYQNGFQTAALQTPSASKPAAANAVRRVTIASTANIRTNEGDVRVYNSDSGARLRQAYIYGRITSQDDIVFEATESLKIYAGAQVSAPDVVRLSAPLLQLGVSEYVPPADRAQIAAQQANSDAQVSGKSMELNAQAATGASIVIQEAHLQADTLGVSTAGNFTVDGTDADQQQISVAQSSRIDVGGDIAMTNGAQGAFGVLNLAAGGHASLHGSVKDQSSGAVVEGKGAADAVALNSPVSPSRTFNDCVIGGNSCAAVIPPGVDPQPNDPVEIAEILRIQYDPTELQLLNFYLGAPDPAVVEAFTNRGDEEKWN